MLFALHPEPQSDFSYVPLVANEASATRHALFLSSSSNPYKSSVYYNDNFFPALSQLLGIVLLHLKFVKFIFPYWGRGRHKVYFRFRCSCIISLICLKRRLSLWRKITLLCSEVVMQDTTVWLTFLFPLFSHLKNNLINKFGFQKACICSRCFSVLTHK